MGQPREFLLEFLTVNYFGLGDAGRGFCGLLVDYESAVVAVVARQGFVLLDEILVLVLVFIFIVIVKHY